MRCSVVLGLKREGYVAKWTTLKAKLTFDFKCQQELFYEHLSILILKSGIQPVINKNLSETSFNLEKSSKALKTHVFTRITEYSIVTFLYYPELKSRA